MKALLYVLISVLAVTCLGGCWREAWWPSPRVAPARPTGDVEFDATWDAAIAALGKYRFRVDRADRRAGVITTFPLVGRHWFEFWRRDATTRTDVAEGALHTIYRGARVTVTRREVSAGSDKWRAEYDVGVVVTKSRSNRAAPHVTSTSEAYDMFRRPTEIRRIGGPGEGSAGAGGSTPLGRDEKLERLILERIRSLKAKKLGAFSK